MSDDWMRDQSQGDEEPYGHTERQIAFKRLAAHALVDPEFYAKLRDDPEAACEEMYIRLADDDIAYLKSVEWPVLDKSADEIRAALHLEDVVASIW
jgi:hypothetical protein